MEVLKDPTKLNPEVRKYLEKNNEYTEYHLKDTKEFQKKLFNEIKGRIKLDDESLPYTDKKYIYWTKTTKETNYPIKLRKKIGTNKVEEYWSGEKEKSKLNAEYFGIGDLEVSNNDEMLAYSLDLKGSEYFTINVRKISDNKIVTDEILDTSGSITWSLDDKFILNCVFSIFKFSRFCLIIDSNSIAVFFLFLLIILEHIKNLLLRILEDSISSSFPTNGSNNFIIFFFILYSFSKC